MRARACCRLLLAAAAAAVAMVTASSRGRDEDCVWRPAEDVLQKIQTLQARCDSLTLSVERQLAAVRRQQLEAALAAANLTADVTQRLITYRLDHVTRDLAVKDVRLELAELRVDNRQLWQAYDEAKLLNLAAGLLKGHSLGVTAESADREDMAGLRKDVQAVTMLGTELKNGVGDLRAEWLLIKRHVRDLQADSEQLTAGHAALREDAARLTALVDSVRADTRTLKEKQAALAALWERAGGGGTAAAAGRGDDGHQLYGKLDFLSTELSSVSGDLVRLRSEWQRLRLELLAMAMSAASWTPAEVEAWLRQLPGPQPSPPPASQHPQDCHDVYRRGHHTSGVYQILPAHAPQLSNVYCEMVNGSGWTLLQRRQDGTISFNRMWIEYKFGFGSLYGEFWLGNELIHHLTTSKAYVVRVDVWDWEGGRAFAEYDTFKVAGETDKYRLTARDYRGNAGDSLSVHDDMAFSTEDVDNDLHARNCAADNKGGWWFNSCYVSHLNGVYRPGRYSPEGTPFADGIVWYTWRETEFYSLKTTEIKVRPLYV